MFVLYCVLQMPYILHCCTNITHIIAIYTPFVCSVHWSVGQLVGQLFSPLVSWLVGWSVVQSAGQLVSWLVRNCYENTSVWIVNANAHIMYNAVVSTF